MTTRYVRVMSARSPRLWRGGRCLTGGRLADGQVWPGALEHGAGLCPALVAHGVGLPPAFARLIDRAPVIRGSVQIGALDLLYSPRCEAGWARIYLYPGETTMMGEVTVRAGDGRYTTIANPLVKQVDDYTDVIVPGHGGCLGAYGQVYQAGKPVITAFLPCEAPAASPAHPTP